MTAPASPQVYRAINRITAAFAGHGIAKTHVNLVDQYQYRSIDDVMARLNPLLARHRLCVLPRVLVRETEDRLGELEALLVNVRLLVAFDLVSARDGSRHTVQAWGEALDRGDKGTAKAMSAAFKSVMLETFCIPVTSEDSDRGGLRLKAPAREIDPAVSVPDEGWTIWAEQFEAETMLSSDQAGLQGLRLANADRLARLKGERPDLYTGIGRAFAKRAAALSVGHDEPASDGSPRVDPAVAVPDPVPETAAVLTNA